MANKIQVKRSAVPSKVPTTSDIDLGEIAINTYDGKMYIKKDDGTASIVQIGAGGAGTGDVTGPASATDNAVSRFDGTTGKLIQNSVVTISDTGNIAGVSSITTPDYITFDTTANETSAVAKLFWDDGDGVLSNGLKGGNVTLQIGTQEYARVYNDSGSTLTKGQVVYISGAQGNRVAVKLARANLESTSFGTLGLVAETITSGAEGFVIVSGALYKLDTSTLTAGATVYLSPSTAGAITTTKPQAPDQLVVLGWVERVDNTVGSIYVKVDNGYELDELHDVQITSPQSGNILIYDASTSPIGVWKNAFLTDGTGITITEGAGSITIANAGVTSAVAGTGISVSAATGAVTITNTAPDQTVSLTAGTGISTSGTYPSFTITNTAPDQTVTLTNGGSIGISGTYPSFTLTNNGVTSLTGTANEIDVSASSGAVTLSLPATINADTSGNAATATSATTATNIAGGTANQIPYQTGAGATSFITAPTTASTSLTWNGSAFTWAAAGGGTGTVTSVTGTGTASGLSLSGTVTTSGNITLSGTVNSLAAGTYSISISGNAATVTNGVYTTAFTNSISGSFGTGGYQKMQGGLILQWGYFTPAGSNQNTTVTFPLAFPTACLSVQAAPVTTSVNQYASAVNTVTTTTCRITNNTSNPICWHALGY